MPSPIILHLGFSKTASTFFQKEVFGDVGGVIYRGEPFAGSLEGGPFQGILARAVQRSPHVWDRFGKQLIGEVLGAPPHSSRPVLVSDQGAGPHMFEEAPYAGPRWERMRVDAERLASHLMAFMHAAEKLGWGSVYVFLMVRRQDEWLASKYAQRSNRRLGASQKHFEKRIAYVTDRQRGYFADGVVLDYDLLYEVLTETLGSEHLLMLPYELFKNDPTVFFGRLLPFLTGGDSSSELVNTLAARAQSTDRNVRSTSEKKWAIRPLRKTPGSSLRAIQLPKVLRKFDLPDQIPLRLPDWKRSREITLTDDMSRQVIETYEDSNRRLAGRLEIDLGRFGYY